MNHNTFFEKTPPTKLFILVTAPGVISMLVSSLYYTIDGIFVGRLLGADAFAALNLALPLVIINFSVADLIGVGSAIPIAIKLGEKDERSACSIFSAACIMIVLSASILGGFLFFFAEDLMRLMGADSILTDLGSQYLKVYALCSPLTTSLFAVDNYLRICGRIRQSMCLNILMSVLCAALEFLFLFVFRFGIWGAALATCLGMFFCTALGFLPFIRGKLQLKFVKPKIDRKTFYNIIANGSPSFLNNIAGRLFSVVMNMILLHFGGATAVTAYGVLMYADGLVQPVLYGLCDSLQPAIGYNWGAQHFARVKALARRCFVVCAALSVGMTALIFFGRVHLTQIFVHATDTAVIEMSAQALSLGSFAYLTRWISLAAQSFFSAIGIAGKATWISISMAFLFPSFLLLVLAPFGLTGLWLNLPFTCLFGALLSIGLYLKTKKKNT